MVPFYSTSLELILLIIATGAEALLAYAVYENNSKSASNRIFALLSIVTALWLLVNYGTNHIASAPNGAMFVLLVNRLGIFFAAAMSALFLLLAHTIPSEEIRFRKFWFYLIVVSTIVMMLLNISPYAYTGIVVSQTGTHPLPGPGLIPFSIISTLFSALAVYFLIRSYYRSKGAARAQLKLVLIGMLTMLTLIIATILVPLIILNSLEFLALTPIYTLIFLGMTAYAITKYQLFNIKVIVAQALTFVIWIVLFAKIFGENNVNAQILDGLVLIFMLVFGALLVQSVQKEIKLREEIERLSQEKSEFMSFASHEIRNPITAMRGYASLIVDGTTGNPLPEVKDAAEKILVNGNTVLGLISQFLSKSKLELGQLSYTITDFDAQETVASVADGFKPHADQKGLTLSKHIDFPHLMAHGDEGKLREVLGNLIDNSLKYTKQGTVLVILEKRNGIARITVADTGVGIPHETLSHLFQKFSRADAQKMNLLGTGLGLYLAKTLVEGMGGKIWAESDGPDKGSRFIIELPAV